MNKEKLEYIVLILLTVILAGVLGFVLLGYILPLLSPFLIAWFAALAVRAPADKISNKIKISPKVIRPTLAVGSVILIFGALILLIYGFADFISRALSDIANGGDFYIFLSNFASPRLSFFDGRLPDGVAEGISDAIRAVLSSLLELLGGIITNIVSFLPKALLFILITLISLIFFAIDLEKINGFILSLLPKNIGQKFSKLRANLFKTMGKYVKSYLQIMLITFVMLFLGFVLLRVDDAFIIAVLTAVLDLLPVLGVGIVLVPWSIFSFAVGNAGLGIGLIILFVVYTVIRELLEPKILGKSLDMHPIVTLISLYLGFALFGVMGLLVLPLLSVLVSALFKKDESAHIDKGTVGQ